MQTVPSLPPPPPDHLAGHLASPPPPAPIARRARAPGTLLRAAMTAVARARCNGRTAVVTDDAYRYSLDIVQVHAVVRGMVCRLCGVERRAVASVDVREGLHASFIVGLGWRDVEVPVGV